MRKARNNIFLDSPEALKEMLDLRSRGWSFTKLALKYDVDRKCAYAYCVKYNVRPLVKRIERIKRKIPQPVKKGYFDEFGERINEGHSYAHYLKKAGIIHRPSKKVFDL